MKNGGYSAETNPFRHPANADSKVVYSRHMLPGTLDILGRTVKVPIKPDWTNEQADTLVSAIRAPLRDKETFAGTADHLEIYNKNGYVILEDVIPPAIPPSVQEACEDVIVRTLDTGHAEREDATGFMKQYRFQNPHRPELVALSLAFIGAAAFCYAGGLGLSWYLSRDSYGWGKDSVKERLVWEHLVWPCTQVLPALQDDAASGWCRDHLTVPTQLKRNSVLRMAGRAGKNTFPVPYS